MGQFEGIRFSPGADNDGHGRRPGGPHGAAAVPPGPAAGETGGGRHGGSVRPGGNRPRQDKLNFTVTVSEMMRITWL